MYFTKRTINILAVACVGLLLGASVDEARGQSQCQATELGKLLAAAGSVGIGAEEPIQRSGDAVVIKSATLPWGMQGSASAQSPATGKIYIFGGDRPAGPGSDKILEYDPATDTLIIKAATLPSGNRALGCATDPATGKIYVFGGMYVATELGDILEYDPVADTLVVKSATLPPAAGVGCAADTATGKIYVFGGRDDAIWFDEIRQYDPATDTIVTMSATLPSERYGMGCAAYPGTGKIYCFGGYSVAGGGTFVDEILEYDPGTDTLVTKLATLPSPKYSSGCAADPATGKIYSLGGSGGSGGLDEIVEYDPATDTCVTRPATLPSINGGPTASADAATGKIYLFGGDANGGTFGPRLDTIIEYDPPDECPPGTFALVDAGGDFAGWCLSTSHPNSLDIYVDAVDVDQRFALIQLSKDFTDPPGFGDLITPMLIDFVQVSPDESTANMIYIADESVTNNTGVNWTDFHWILFDGPEAWFDVAASSGFDTSPFAMRTFEDFIDPPVNNQAKRLSAAGGVVPNMSTFFPGDGTGELVIGVDLSGEGPVSFTLKERPTTTFVHMSVRSNVYGASVTVSPADIFGMDDGAADFMRYYHTATPVTLTAPQWASLRCFLRWNIDGVPQPLGERTINVTMSGACTAEALYLGLAWPRPDAQLELRPAPPKAAPE